jgi:hypothetical protein
VENKIKGDRSQNHDRQHHKLKIGLRTNDVNFNEITSGGGNITRFGHQSRCDNPCRPGHESPLRVRRQSSLRAINGSARLCVCRITSRDNSCLLPSDNGCVNNAVNRFSSPGACACKTHCAAFLDRGGCDTSQKANYLLCHCLFLLSMIND